MSASPTCAWAASIATRFRGREMDTRALQLVAREQLSNVPGYAVRDISQTTEFRPCSLYAAPLRLFSGILNLIGETRIRTCDRPAPRRSDLGSVGAFGLLWLGFRSAELGRFALKMDPELDPVR